MKVVIDGRSRPGRNGNTTRRKSCTERCRHGDNAVVDPLYNAIRLWLPADRREAGSGGWGGGASTGRWSQEKNEGGVRSVQGVRLLVEDNTRVFGSVSGLVGVDELAVVPTDPAR